MILFRGERGMSKIDAADDAVAARKKEAIEAYGRKGMKSKPWRKTFKNADDLDRWVLKHDAVVDGWRTYEQN